jgi:undecaprenyl-diphosphatase
MMKNEKRQFPWLLGGAVISLTLYLGLMAAVTHGWGPMADWDNFCNNRMHALARATPTLVTAFLEFTKLGNLLMLIAVMALMIVVLALRRQWRLALVMLVVYLVGHGMVDLHKSAVGRDRPAFGDPIVNLANKSFPSGHAGGTMIVYGLLAYLLVRAWPRGKWLTLAISGTFILAMGFSRILLGAHWFSDVIGGYLLGLAMLLVAVRDMNAAQPATAIVTESAPASIPAAQLSP